MQQLGSEENAVCSSLGLRHREMEMLGMPGNARGGVEVEKLSIATLISNVHFKSFTLH